MNQSLELFQWEQCCWSPFLASESKSGVISVGTVLLVSLFRTVNQSLQLFQWEQCCWSPFLASESKSGVIFVVAILRIDLRCWSVNLDL